MCCSVHSILKSLLCEFYFKWFYLKIEKQIPLYPYSRLTCMSYFECFSESVEWFSRLERAVFRGVYGEIFAFFQACVGNFDTILQWKVVGTLYLDSSYETFKYFAFFSVCDKFELLGHIRFASLIISSRLARIASIDIGQQKLAKRICSIKKSVKF